MSEQRVVLLGSGGVGKSAITIQFIQGNFVEKYDPTIEDSYRKQVEVDGVAYMLDILDTAGQEEYSAMRDQYMNSGQGFILVYSITDSTSYEDINNIYQQLIRIKESEEVPVVIIGNKCDLEEERVVTKEDGERLATSCGNALFFEASAKSNINVEESFHALVRKMNGGTGAPAPAPVVAPPPTATEAAAPAPAPAAPPKPRKKKSPCSLL